MFLILLLLVSLSGVAACASLSNLPSAQPNLGSSGAVYPINIVATSGIVTLNTQITLTIMQ